MYVNIPNLPQTQSVATTLAKWRILLQWHANPGYRANACLQCSKNRSSPVRMTQSCQVNNSKLIKVVRQPEGLCNRPTRHVMVVLTSEFNEHSSPHMALFWKPLLLCSTSYIDCSRSIHVALDYLFDIKQGDKSSNLIKYISRLKHFI